METAITSLLFVFGIIIGSFLNVLIVRLPRQEVITGRSHCVFCGHVLQAHELVPLASFLALKGRCSKCKQRISPRYFLVELATGGLFALAYLVLEPTGAAAYTTLVLWLAAIALSVVVFVVDLEHYLILDNIVFPGVAVVLAAKIVLDVLQPQQTVWYELLTVQSIAGAAAGTLPFYLLWWFSKGTWMGFGDVKLMLFLGSLLGVKLVFVAIFLAVLAGGLTAVPLLLFTRKTMKSHIPFGAFLAPAAIVALFYGEKILAWYLSSLGL